MKILQSLVIVPLLVAQFSHAMDNASQPSKNSKWELTKKIGTPVVQTGAGLYCLGLATKYFITGTMCLGMSFIGMKECAKSKDGLAIGIPIFGILGAAGLFEQGKAAVSGGLGGYLLYRGYRNTQELLKNPKK